MEKACALRLRTGVLTSVFCLGVVACGGGGGGGGGGGSPTPASIGAETDGSAIQGNRPPIITGTPPRNVTTGMTYRFRPGSFDPDGDALSFSIANKPGWAQFDQSTGQLQGRPDLGDVGNYGNIRIRVTDGIDTTPLAVFTIEVLATATRGFTLSWSPPVTNTDGSPLQDLAGYRIYLGRQAGSYPDVVEINNPGLTTYVFDQLPAGIYYVSISAVNRKGRESPLSRELSTAL